MTYYYVSSAILRNADSLNYGTYSQCMLVKPWFHVKIIFVKEFQTPAAVIGLPSYFFISGVVPS